MESIAKDGGATLYRLSADDVLERFILTTPESRSICNDPLVFGVTYTKALEKAVGLGFTLLQKASLPVGDKHHAFILHILRGGLNFGIRDALHETLGWSATTSAFISSQRAREGKEWHITESSYKKIPVVREADIFFGDVVATGVSLRHALTTILEELAAHGGSCRSITFFTIGGGEAEKLLEDAAGRAAEISGKPCKARIIYFEGIFGVARDDSPLSVFIPDTDLLRHPATLAPEFAASQREHMTYALERCTIYDAGSRAFYPEEYLGDVREYWEKVRTLGESGVSVAQYLKERFPEDERLTDARFHAAYDAQDSLTHLAKERLAALDAHIPK